MLVMCVVYRGEIMDVATVRTYICGCYTLGNSSSNLKIFLIPFCSNLIGQQYSY